MRRSLIVAPGARSAMSGFTSKTAKTVFDFASIARNLVMDIRDSYRPGPYHMRGPGPKWRAKHQLWPKFDPAAAEQHQLAPVHVRRLNAAKPR
jgi:hypothetical protein